MRLFPKAQAEARAPDVLGDVARNQEAHAVCEDGCFIRGEVPASGTRTVTMTDEKQLVELVRLFVCSRESN